MICNQVTEIEFIIKQIKQILQINDCTKDVLKELHVQEEEISDLDEESAEVEDKQTDDNYHVAINAVNH